MALRIILGLIVLLVAASLVFLPLPTIGDDVAMPDFEKVVGDQDHTHDEKPTRRRARLCNLPRFSRRIAGPRPGTGSSRTSG